MQNLTILWYYLYVFIFYFTIYAFLGWCLEVTYAAVNTGKFVNRGFLNGTVCPVYGFGVVIVIAILSTLKQNLFLLFVGSILLTSLLEYITGFILEKVFHNRWWDYSMYPFNIHGYICLKFSLAWGGACVFIIRIIHPMIAEIIGFIPRVAGNILLAIIMATFITDFATTVSAILSLNVRLKQMEDISAILKNQSNVIGQNISEEVIELKERYEKLAQQRIAFNARLIKAFPDIRSTRHFEAFEDLKKRIGKIQKIRK